MSNYHPNWCQATAERLARRERYISNPTVDPDTGERIRPMSQTEAYYGLADNSWAVRF